MKTDDITNWEGYESGLCKLALPPSWCVDDDAGILKARVPNRGGLVSLPSRLWPAATLDLVKLQMDTTPSKMDKMTAKWKPFSPATRCDRNNWEGFRGDFNVSHLWGLLGSQRVISVVAYQDPVFALLVAIEFSRRRPLAPTIERIINTLWLNDPPKEVHIDLA